MSGIDFVTQIWFFIADIFGRFVSMLNHDATKSYFLTSFLYVLVAAWIVWIVLNTFVIRPIAVGGISTLAEGFSAYQVRRDNIAFARQNLMPVIPPDQLYLSNTPLLKDKN